MSRAAEVAAADISLLITERLRWISENRFRNPDVASIEWAMFLRSRDQDSIDGTSRSMFKRWVKGDVTPNLKALPLVVAFINENVPRDQRLPVYLHLRLAPVQQTAGAHHDPKTRIGYFGFRPIHLPKRVSEPGVLCPN